MDFFGDVFGHSASQALKAFEDLNRVLGDNFSSQDWFNCKDAEAVPARLPWEAITDEEKGFERQLREAVLLISQSPQLFLQDADPVDDKLSTDVLAPAGAVLEADEGLRQLRFRLVPRYCSEEQFWQRYFAAVAKVKQRVKAEQAWGDFDMLDDEDEENADADAAMSAPPQQVELPSMRQPSNAIDTSTDPLPSLHADCNQNRSTDPLLELHADCDQNRSKLCSSMPAATKLRQSEVHEAVTAQTEEQQHEMCQPQADQPEVQGMKSVTQQPTSVQTRCDGRVPAQIRAQSAERMIMSGDLGTSQASSFTEAMLMSPRSVDSSATKAAAPSPVSVIPLQPDMQQQSPTILRDPNTRVQGDKLNPSSFDKAAEQREGQAGRVAVIPANLHCQTAECAREAGQDAQLKHSSIGRIVVAAKLGLPFKTAQLQKLADAALSCKKFQTMQEVVDREGSGGRAVGGWPSIAARELFETIAASPAQPQADLVTQIAVTMLNMQHVGEMAVLWTEILHEVDCQWISGRRLPACPDSDTVHMKLCNLSSLSTCLGAVDQALKIRQLSNHAVQVDVAGIVHKGSQGLNRLKALPPRLVFDNLFAALATSGLEAAAAAAVGPGGSEVLVTGVRQVEELTKAAFCQPTLSRSQLTKLCQVFAKLEGMFQVAVEQNELKQAAQQQADWMGTAAIIAGSPGSSCSADDDATWSLLEYESWTLL